MGIDWLIDMRLARAPMLWAGLLCFSAATFLGTLAHVARLKGLKALRYAISHAEYGFISCPHREHSKQGSSDCTVSKVAAVCAHLLWPHSFFTQVGPETAMSDSRSENLWEWHAIVLGAGTCKGCLLAALRDRSAVGKVVSLDDLLSQRRRRLGRVYPDLLCCLRAGTGARWGRW